MDNQKTNFHVTIALGILQEIKEKVNTCCAITMEPDEVLELIEQLKEIIINQGEKNE
jgi:hypothetical protein|tara:strand:- start:1285 stop:1455 length:171 start_codon:yes stop_codon:yes gene_type:complete